MTQLYVKELSRLTGVSVQTLHHYDRIGLLMPSIRLSNGYRIYCEKDLLKLQQIIALKFFGFELSQIRALLMGDMNVSDHFLAQAQSLEEKAKILLEASKMLKSVIAECHHNKSIPWNSLLNLIGMNAELEKKSADKVLTSEKLKQYVNFESELKIRFTEKEQNALEEAWTKLINQIGSNIDKIPTSVFGMNIAKQAVKLINNLYGKKHSNLKCSIWQKNLNNDKIDEAYTLGIISWLDAAIDGYYQAQIFKILNKLGSVDSKKLSSQWDSLMEEMFGESKSLKQELINTTIADPQVNEAAKKWLRQFSTK